MAIFTMKLEIETERGSHRLTVEEIKRFLDALILNGRGTDEVYADNEFIWVASVIEE